MRDGESMSRAEDHRTPSKGEVSNGCVGRVVQTNEVLEHAPLSSNAAPQLVNGASEAALLNLGDGGCEPAVPCRRRGFAFL
jgi:hypothetical protein